MVLVLLARVHQRRKVKVAAKYPKVLASRSGLLVSALKTTASLSTWKTRVFRSGLQGPLNVKGTQSMLAKKRSISMPRIAKMRQMAEIDSGIIDLRPKDDMSVRPPPDTTRVT